MTITRNLARWIALPALLAWLAGCVGTQVNSLSSTHANAPLERLLIVHRSGSFGRNGVPANSAESMGNRNLGELVPHLYTRLPLAFQSQGVQARMVSELDVRTVRMQPGEKLLWIQPDSATYNPRGGQVLYMLADLVDPASRQSLWRGQVRMGTPGYGKFDDSVADSIGRQIVQELLAARVVVMPGPSAAVAAGPTAPASAPAAMASPASAAASAPAVVARPAAPAVSPVAAPALSQTAASIEDVNAIPYLNDRGRKGYADWLRKSTPRAFAIATDGHWYATWGLKTADPALPSDPSQRALLLCERAAGKPCRLYAVNGAVVWKDTP